MANISLLPFEERRIDGELRFFIINPPYPDDFVGRAEHKGDRWEAWFLAAGMTGRDWCKTRDVDYETEEAAAEELRLRVNENCWFSG